MLGKRKKMTQEKRKKTRGKRKVKSGDCCVTIKPKPSNLLSVHPQTSEADFASGKYKKATKCSTYKWHFGQFWLCMARQ